MSRKELDFSDDDIEMAIRRSLEEVQENTENTKTQEEEDLELAIRLSIEMSSNITDKKDIKLEKKEASKITLDKLVKMIVDSEPGSNIIDYDSLSKSDVKKLQNMVIDAHTEKAAKEKNKKEAALQAEKEFIRLKEEADKITEKYNKQKEAEKNKKIQEAKASEEKAKKDAEDEEKRIAALAEGNHSNVSNGDLIKIQDYLYNKSLEEDRKKDQKLQEEIPKLKFFEPAKLMETREDLHDMLLRIKISGPNIKTHLYTISKYEPSCTLYLYIRYLLQSSDEFDVLMIPNTKINLENSWTSLDTIGLQDRCNIYISYR